MFLSSYRNTSESLGEREMLQASVSTALEEHFGRTAVEEQLWKNTLEEQLWKNTENMYSISISFRKYRDEKKKINLFTLIIKM